jgi:hypothetical protein
LLTNNDNGLITATIQNFADQELERLARATITEGSVLLTRQIENRPAIPPGGETTLEWSVTPQAAAYNRLILFRVYVFPALSNPSASAYCGIIIADIPVLTGNQALFLISLISISLMIIGRILWVKNTKENAKDALKALRAMDVLVILVILCMTVSLLGYWILGLMSLVIAFIVLGSTIAFYYTST